MIWRTRERETHRPDAGKRSRTAGKRRRRSSAAWASGAIPYLAIGAGLWWARDAWVAFLLYHAGVLAALAATGSLPTLRHCARGWNARLFIPVVLFGASGGAVLALSWSWVAFDVAAELGRIGLAGGPWTGFWIYHATVNPILEETFWRGWFPDRPAWSGAALFAGYHLIVLGWFVPWIWLPVGFVSLFVAALVWRYVREKTGGLLLPVLSHAASSISVLGFIAGQR